MVALVAARVVGRKGRKGRVGELVEETGVGGRVGGREEVAASGAGRRGEGNE